MAALVGDTRGSLYIIVSGDTPYTDEEFDASCKVTERLGSEYPLVRVLVVCAKAVPTAAQRKRADEMGKKAKVKCATLSNYLVTRAVVKLFSLFMDIRAHRPSDFEQAMDFLKATPEERTWARQAIARMRDEVGPTAPSID